MVGALYICNKDAGISDVAGNTLAKGTVKSASMYLDNTAPTLTLGTVISTTNSITIPISTNTDAHSGINTTICEYGTSTSYGSKGTISNNQCMITGLNEGTTYYYKITSTDKSGNSANKTGNVKTAVKPAPPKVILNLKSASQTSIVVQAVSIPSEGATIANYKFKIGNNAYVDNGTSASYTFTGLSTNPGTYTIYVQVTDNFGSTATDDLIVDISCMNANGNRCGPNNSGTLHGIPGIDGNSCEVTCSGMSGTNSGYCVIGSDFCNGYCTRTNTYCYSDSEMNILDHVEYGTCSC